MGDMFSGIFTVNFWVENFLWTLMIMIVARLWDWARAKPIEAKRRGWFWVISGVGVFVLLSALTYAVRGPTSPDLRGGIDQITVNALPDKPGSIGLLLVFHVHNVGAPSVVENYQLAVTPAGWKSPISATPLFIPKVLSLPSAPNMPQVFIEPFICGNDALYRKTAERPLVYGEQVRGYLFFEVPGLTTETLKNPTGTKLIVSFDDVLGKTYTNDLSWPAVSKPPGYLPGISVPTSQNPDEACK